MLERIKINEEKLDKALKVFRELENSLEKYQEMIVILKELNDYYGSSEWFLDKENYEKGNLEQIKAGVLSEDSVWNLNEDIKELAKNMHALANEILNCNNK